MTTFSLRERGWRDGFWGREPQDADEVYLEGWECGRRAGDRTRAPDHHESGSQELPSDYLGATSELPSDYLGATSELPSDYLPATSELPDGYR